MQESGMLPCCCPFIGILNPAAARNSSEERFSCISESTSFCNGGTEKFFCFSGFPETEKSPLNQKNVVFVTRFFLESERISERV